MKKVASGAILQLLHKELSDSGKTDSWSCVSASATTVSRSGSDVDYTWEETQTPYDVCIAPGSCPASLWYGQKRYQEPQTRSHPDHAVSAIPDEPGLPGVSYAHEWYTSLHLWGTASFLTEHARDSLFLEYLPLPASLWEHSCCPHLATNASQWRRRIPDVLFWAEDSCLHWWHHGCSAFLHKLFFECLYPFSLHSILWIWGSYLEFAAIPADAHTLQEHTDCRCAYLHTQIFMTIHRQHILSPVTRNCIQLHKLTWTLMQQFLPLSSGQLRDGGTTTAFVRLECLKTTNVVSFDVISDCGLTHIELLSQLSNRFTLRRQLDDLQSSIPFDIFGGLQSLSKELESFIIYLCIYHAYSPSLSQLMKENSRTMPILKEHY